MASDICEKHAPDNDIANEMNRKARKTAVVTAYINV